MTQATKEAAGKKHTKPAQSGQKKGNSPEPPPPPPTENASSPASQVRQASFLKEMAANRFNISVACEKAGMARRTFYWWLENSSDFKHRYEDLLESRLDKWEECLHKNILAGSETSVIFALKTKGKKRGYNEKETQDEKVVEILSQVMAGDLTALEAAFKINILGYPLPEVIKIQLAKKDEEDPDDDKHTPTSPEKLEALYQEALASCQEQLGAFLPERRAEVVGIKAELKSAESFQPGPGTGDSTEESF